MFTTTTIGSSFTSLNGRRVGNTKLKDDFLFRKTKSFRCVFDTVVDLVWGKEIRHDDDVDEFIRMIDFEDTSINIEK